VALPLSGAQRATRRGRREVDHVAIGAGRESHIRIKPSSRKWQSVISLEPSACVADPQHAQAHLANWLERLDLGAARQAPGNPSSGTVEQHRVEIHVVD
jgi:hypothetical protein